VGAHGKINLRGESALEQRFRLEAEGVVFRGGRVWMEKHQHRDSPKRRAKKPRATRS